jgi:hypothetical protein
MTEGHEGFAFAPAAALPDTLLLAEKTTLPFAVEESDAAELREGFMAGLQALPGLAIEMQEESILPALMLFEARFTFLDNSQPGLEVQRKRWIRSFYAGTTNLVLVAQGSTPEEFDYWLPMFYNILHTFELWPLV